MATNDNLTDEIRFRSPNGLKSRLKKIARLHRQKYQALARNVIHNYVEKEEKEHPEVLSKKAA